MTCQTCITNISRSFDQSQSSTGYNFFPGWNKSIPLCPYEFLGILDRLERGNPLYGVFCTVGGIDTCHWKTACLFIVFY